VRSSVLITHALYPKSHPWNRRLHPRSLLYGSSFFDHPGLIFCIAAQPFSSAGTACTLNLLLSKHTNAQTNRALLSRDHHSLVLFAHLKPVHLLLLSATLTGTLL